jgi:hypothetical protein
LGSYLSWMDHSEQARRKMLDVIDLFAEQDTRDELGLGSVRDAFSDLLFPGTSTIQTRAKYFLFVPWIYLSLERTCVESAKVAQRARNMEIDLINALAESDDKDGIIGIQARESLQRLPSNIYWQGLHRLGIRVFPGSQDQYHRSLDSYYKSVDNALPSEDPEARHESARINWHSGLPQVPKEFLHKAGFALNRNEARYLLERIMNCDNGTYFAFLVDRARPWENVKFPWEHPQYGELSDRIKDYIEHARNFSESMWGAALLYNLMLAESQPSEGRANQYETALEEEWWPMIQERHHVLQEWDRKRFWEVAHRGNPRIGPPTKFFVASWLDLVRTSTKPKEIIRSDKARDLIRNRERALKRSLARLANRRALENWNGDSGSAQLNFRWPVVQRIVADILTGLGKEPSDA